MMKRRGNVLKLVCPRGAVEFHRKPITAAEVMNRKPRHFVTRPDVFKYPWVVVRPESVLEPGEVFYVVPARTIYRLLQSKGYYRGCHREANLLQGDCLSPDQCQSKQFNIDHLCAVKRGSNHDCENSERCNLGELDQRIVLSDPAAIHLCNVLVAKRRCHDQESEDSSKCRAPSILKEATQSHHRRRQLLLDSSEKQNHCMLKGYDAGSAQLRSNTEKRWSSKQTWGQNLGEYNFATSVVSRQSDKGSLKLANLVSLIPKLPFDHFDRRFESISSRTSQRKKISPNARNPWRDMASDGCHRSMGSYVKGGNGESKYNSSSRFSVLVGGRHVYSSSKVGETNAAREFQSGSVGSNSEIPSVKEQHPEDISSEDSSFTFDIPSTTEADIPHSPVTVGYNSIFNYANSQGEEKNSCWHAKLRPPNASHYRNRVSEAEERRQDSSVDPISDSVLQIYPNNRTASSAMESGNDQGRENGVSKASGSLEKDLEVRSCLRKTKDRSPVTPRVTFTLPGEDCDNLRVEVFEFKED